MNQIEGRLPRVEGFLYRTATDFMAVAKIVHGISWTPLAPTRRALDGLENIERTLTMVSNRAPDKATHRAWRSFGQRPREKEIPRAEMQQRTDSAMRGGLNKVNPF